MGLSKYFGRFWFAAEPVFGIVMTLCFLGILRNDMLLSDPILLDKIMTMVIGAAISCCIAWGIVDGIFYVWENHSLIQRKNITINYAKNQDKRTESHRMVEEDLKDTYVDLLNKDEKESIYEKVVTHLAGTKSKAKISMKDDLITIFLDFCLNFGACLLVLLPFFFLRNLTGVPQLLNLSFLTAIILLFIIGVWFETRKSLFFKIRKGLNYSLLGIIITILTFYLGG